MKYDALTVMEDIVATQTSRLEIDVPGEGGRGWSRTESSIEVGNDATLDEQWREDISRGARHLREESYVRVSEPHYDAKVWPVVHPYGTGSLLAEPGAGSAHKHAKNRLVLIQSWFRKSALWSFWFLNRLITSELFFTNKKRQKGIQYLIRISLYSFCMRSNVFAQQQYDLQLGARGRAQEKRPIQSRGLLGAQ